MVCRDAATFIPTFGATFLNLLLSVVALMPNILAISHCLLPLRINAL